MSTSRLDHSNRDSTLTPVTMAELQRLSPNERAHLKPLSLDLRNDALAGQDIRGFPWAECSEIRLSPDTLKGAVLDARTLMLLLPHIRAQGASLDNATIVGPLHGAREFDKRLGCIVDKYIDLQDISLTGARCTGTLHMVKIDAAMLPLMIFEMGLPSTIVGKPSSTRTPPLAAITKALKRSMTEWVVESAVPGIGLLPSVLPIPSLLKGRAASSTSVAKTAATSLALPARPCTIPAELLEQLRKGIRPATPNTHNGQSFVDKHAPKRARHHEV